MAIEQRIANLGFLIAAVDLSGAQFKAVAISAANTVNLPSAKGGIALGILQNKPKAGEACDVMVIGVSKLVPGTGNLADAANWETDTDGTGVTAEVGKVTLGTVLMGATAPALATVTIGIPCGAVVHA